MSRFVTERRASIVLAGVTAVVTVVLALTGLNGAPRRMIDPLATGYAPVVHRGRWWTLLTAPLATATLAELLAVVVVLVLVVGLAERVLGSRRVLLAWLVTGVLGNALGVGMQVLGLATRRYLPVPGLELAQLDPFTPIAGVVLTTSAFVGPLWRRRIRVLGFAALAAILLYSGTAADLYRLCGALIGLVLGLALTRRRPSWGWPRGSHHEVRGILAALIGIAAAGPLLATTSRHGTGILRPLGLLLRDPAAQRAVLVRECRLASAICDHDGLLGRLNGPAPVLGTVLPLLVLAVAAVGVWQGRRIAGVVAVAVLVFFGLAAGVYYGLLPSLVDPDEIAVPGLVPGLDTETVLATLLPLAIAAGVLVNLRHLPVLPTPRAVRGFVIAVAAVLALSATLYVLGGALVGSQFAPRQTALSLLGDLPERFVPVGFLGLRRIDPLPLAEPARILHDWVGPLFWAALLVATAAAGLSLRRNAVGGDEVRMRALLRRGSEGSISYMATWTGNRYWFSADGRHGVAYRTAAGVALAITAPAGPDEGRAEAALQWAAHCDDNGLAPVFYAVSPAFAERLRVDRTWPTVEVGDDAVIDPATFSMTGKRWQDVRSSFNRAARVGVSAVWARWRDLSLARRAQVQAISEEWIAERRLPELGFTIGGVDELIDPEVRLLLAVDEADQVQAVTSWLPTWRDGRIVGSTLDFMRRRPDGMNGIMEFLIATAALDAQASGLEFLSLSVAPLAGAGDDDGTSLDRILGRVARALEPVYGFSSLGTFKAKFAPRFAPVVMAYPEVIDLPAIAVAVARCYLPEVSLPSAVRLLGALR